jgi:hypothetical protein
MVDSYTTNYVLSTSQEVIYCRTIAAIAIRLQHLLPRGGVFSHRRNWRAGVSGRVWYHLFWLTPTIKPKQSLMATAFSR